MGKLKKIKKKYKFAVIAADIAICTVQNDDLKVLLIKVKKWPFSGQWALPGGLIRPDETLEAAAGRHLFDKAGVRNVYLEQLYTFGRVDRDPFGRVVSVAYMALIPSEGLALKTTKEYGDIAWFSVKKLPRLAYDHREMIQRALSRLKAKLEYTNIIYSLLPDEFTLSDLQRVYEVILNKRIDKRNFRKKILSLGLIQRVQRKRKGRPHRPAELYRFVQRRPQVIDIL